MEGVQSAIAMYVLVNYLCIYYYLHIKYTYFYCLPLQYTLAKGIKVGENFKKLVREADKSKSRYERGGIGSRNGEAGK